MRKGMTMKQANWFFATILLTLLYLSGCAQNEPSPEEAFTTFADHWKNEDYGQMYHMLSEQVKEELSEETFVERYETIYGGISANNLVIEMIIDENEEEAATDESSDELTAEIDYRFSLDTFAGTITEERMTASLTYVEDEEEPFWSIEWEPSMILPSLEEGDTVHYETLAPARGEIVDRNGVELAINGVAYEIGLVPERIEDHDDTFARVSEDLGVSEERLDELLNQSWVQDDTFVPVRTISSSDTSFRDALMDIPGVTYREIGAREYPFAESFAHLIGYVGAITAEELEERKEEGYHAQSTIGKTGLESILEPRLRGETGGRIFIRTADGELKETLLEKEAVDGETVQLTIDADVQRSIYDSLADEGGLGVSLHPTSGEVLALVSSPSYDPNEFVVGITSTRYEELQEDERNPLLNRFTKRFTPGSSIKPITAAVALEHGLDPTEGRTITGDRWQPDDDSWGNYTVKRVNVTDGPVDLRDALIYSDNIYFAQIALEIGADVLTEGFEAFGFGEDIPFAYGMPASSLANDGLDSSVLLANTAYGQGEMLVTPLHLSLMYASIMNNGTIPTPLVLAGDEPDMWKENLISEEHAKLLLDDLKEVVRDSSGTGHGAYMDDRPLAGKTGTTEYKESQEEEGKEDGWFVAMDEDMLVLMMIEDVEDRGGSKYVVPKVRSVFED